jgi:hypothetical protein
LVSCTATRSAPHPASQSRKPFFSAARMPFTFHEMSFQVMSDFSRFILQQILEPGHGL